MLEGRETVHEVGDGVALGDGHFLTEEGRQLVVLIPVAMFLASFGEVTLIWWAFPIAELMSTVLSIIFFLRLYNRTVKTL